MSNNEFKKCKSKNCNNPVLDGKYCLQCNQTRKERKEKYLAGFGGAMFLGVLAANKKGAFKQVPNLVGKVIKGFLKV